MLTEFEQLVDIDTINQYERGSYSKHREGDSHEAYSGRCRGYLYNNEK